jgi:hypothetical protein
MKALNYVKRRNEELFQCLESPDTLHLSSVQNYTPIYNRFFNLNQTNYDHVNFNHEWFLTNVKEGDVCEVTSATTGLMEERDVFFKMAPMLDPFKFLIGKYAGIPLQLPTLGSLNPSNIVDAKLADPDNTSYVDGLFAFVSSRLCRAHNFVHAVDYYGSFIAIKNNLQLNVFDDLEHLRKSEYFNKNLGSAFFMDDVKAQPTLTVDYDSSLNIDCEEFDDAFDNVFDDTQIVVDDDGLNEVSVDFSGDVVKTQRSDSTCSSRSSHTNNSEQSEQSEEQSISEESNYEEETALVTIPQFPVHVVALEKCDNTFDDLILSSDLTEDEWLSALMQIIMILITFQNAFQFTHNDLHTSNIMYNYTDQKFLYYRFNGTNYKVPTFNRVYKIIDFGRSIFTVDGKKFCSDSFQMGGDAATQYNTEPFFDATKPRIEPNYSFDLCRLACSIYDYICDDKLVSDKVKAIIGDWCNDDKGNSVLYKSNGQERYPDFKLYKMIARHVHKHTPHAQLARPEFKQFVCGKATKQTMDLDKIL